MEVSNTVLKMDRLITTSTPVWAWIFSTKSPVLINGIFPV
jgi:hypothetical protein